MLLRTIDVFMPIFGQSPFHRSVTLRVIADYLTLISIVMLVFDLDISKITGNVNLQKQFQKIFQLIRRLERGQISCHLCNSPTSINFPIMRADFRIVHKLFASVAKETISLEQTVLGAFLRMLGTKTTPLRGRSHIT